MEEGEEPAAPSGSSAQTLVGQVLEGRWRVRRRVGKGTFSEIYEASDLHRSRDADGRHPHVAMKVAREGSQKRSMLLHEQEVLQDLQGCSAVARYVGMGTERSYHFLIMQLLGENMSNMRRLTREKRLTLRTTVLIGVQMVEAIQHMHELGYVHRDIKPSNCCVGLRDARFCYLLDFGLVRRLPSPRLPPRLPPPPRPPPRLRAHPTRPASPPARRHAGGRPRTV